jgi:hypothetical protein
MQVVFMFNPWSLAFTGMLVLVEATGRVPTVNIAATCRAAEKALLAISKDSRGADFDGCMRQQKEALGILTKNWGTYPTADKTRCVNPGHYMPSYVEWLTCLENAEYVRKLAR